MRRTGGTETSKYPQEKKTIVIPSVAASETRNSPNLYYFGGMGVVGPVGDIPRSYKFMYSRAVWKVRP